MFQPWRIKLREVEAALKGGRLDEASRLLSQGDLRQYYPAQKLIAQLAEQMLQRGRKRMAQGESLGGWQDLEQAEKFGAPASAAGALRQELIGLALKEAEELLAAGSCTACLAALETLQRRGGTGHEVRQLIQVARKYDAALGEMRKGHFAEAMDALAVASSLRPDLNCVEQAAAECQRKRKECSLLQESLHQALADEDWAVVLHTADQMLQHAPQWQVALEARQRAWARVGMQVTATPRVAVVHPRFRPDMNKRENDGSAAEHTMAGPRFLLWIDGVGGFLVCEADSVVIGQPAAGGHVDVPILGDISRQHARIHRNGEGYLLQPLRKTKVGGRVVEGWHTLADGQVLELGEGVQLRFRRPHALSTTAKMEFVSHHRTQPATDGVILMSDSFLVGPGPNCHVCCPAWRRQLVFYHQDGELWCRTEGRLQIDGRPCDGEGRLTRSSQVIGEEFSLSLEEVC